MVAAVLPLSRRAVRGWWNPWLLACLLLAALLLGPILAVFIAASGDTGGLWAHLSATVLPRYVANTLLLMAGVGTVALLFGVTAAWVVVRYDFAGRRALEWMLLLPAAVPAYLIAYTYTDFLEYAGPVQSALRALFGWQDARDYWFPEIRSMSGAALVMGAVLYPYIYLMARIAFALTPASLFEVAMLARRGLFWRVALPLARPAIIAGLAVALMEVISDFGTVEYFAIETLTLGIFNVWLGMNNLAAAARIAAIAFIFVAVLLAVEAAARSRRRFAGPCRRPVPLRPLAVSGWRAAGCAGVCALPVLIGFLLPVGVLLRFVLAGQSPGLTGPVLAAAANSLILAASVALLVMAAAAFMGLVASYGGAGGSGRPALRRLTAIASIGYAFPGTLLAIGVVTAGAAADRHVALMLDGLFGIGREGWLTGGIGLVVLACVIRFQAIGRGAIMSGLDRLSPSLVEASRTLGRGFGASMGAVVAPLIRLSLLAGGLLVFVEVMKELPMTLLLRPFNFETLATYVYQYAGEELLEEAALPALAIVLAGLAPVMAMNALLRRFARW